MSGEQILAISLGMLHGLLIPSLLWWGMTFLREWKWAFYLKRKESLIPVVLLFVFLLSWGVCIASVSGVRFLVQNHITLTNNFPREVSKWWTAGFCLGMVLFGLLWRIANWIKQK